MEGNLGNDAPCLEVALRGNGQLGCRIVIREEGVKKEEDCGGG